MGFVTIDGKKVEINGEKNILELVRKVGIELPTFCYFSELSVYGACRMCSVELEGRGIVASCSTPAEDGMVIYTNTEKTLRVRKMVLELLLANHDRDCTTCEKNGSCKLQTLSYQLGVRKVRFGDKDNFLPLDKSNPSITRDPNKCILCGDCVRVCSEVQGIGAIDFAARGPETVVTTAFGKDLADVECVNCGQCVAVCPTGALTACSETDYVWNALHSPEKTVVVQVAPAVRASLGELFGKKPGENVTGQLVSALKKMGFTAVFDTVFSADLTAVEECHEFLERLQNGEHLPQFTSCCPGWVKYAEQYYPEMLDNLSSCKSPQQMFGTLMKKYYAPKLGVAPENLVFVSVMPCTAKKFEAKREEFKENGVQDVDAVITVNELALLMQQAGIVFDELEVEPFDNPFGFTTGAGTIFGVTGGVSEAVLRAAAGALDLELDKVDFYEARGFEGLKEAEVKLGEQKVRIGIIHGLANARKVIEEVKAKKVNYDIIEVMACPGGCIGGGGQPYPNDSKTREKRGKALYQADKMMQLRSPQDNISVSKLYEDYLKEVGSEKAHQCLHTSYRPRHRINDYPAPEEEPKKIDVSVCVGTGCYLRGSYDVLQNLHKLVDREGVKDKINLNATFCLEKCDKGVSVKVGEKIITNVSVDNLEKIYAEEVQGKLR